MSRRNYRHHQRQRDFGRREPEVSEEDFKKNISEFLGKYRSREEYLRRKGQGEQKVMLTSNFLKVKIRPGAKYHVYPIEFEAESDSTFYNLHRDTKDKIIKELEYYFNYYERDCIVTSTNVISRSHADYVYGKKLTVKVTRYKSKGKEPFKVHFPEEYIVSFGENEEENIDVDQLGEGYQEKEQILNNILHHELSNNEHFQRIYTEKQAGYSKHYLGKKPILESRNFIRGISDTYMNKKIYQTYNISFTSRERGWYLLISPNFRNEDEPFDGLQVFDFFSKYHHNRSRRSMKEIYTEELERDYFITHLIYHNNRRVRPKKITKVRYDMSPRSKPSFGTYQSFEEYYTSVYGDELKEMGIQSIDLNQPLFQVDPDPSLFINHSKQQIMTGTLYYIPQLVGIAPTGEVDIRKYKMDWTSKNSRESLESRIRKVKNFILLLRDCQIDKILEEKYEIQVRLDPENGLEKCEALTLPALTLTNHFSEVVHSLERGTKWEREAQRMKLRLKQRGTGKVITMENYVCVWCEGYDQERRIVLDNISQFGWEKRIGTPQWGKWTKCYELKRSERSILPLLEKIKERDGPGLILMIPDNRKEIYNDFISFCLREGIVEQVIRGDTVRYKRNLRKKIIYNIFLQMYCKLGGFLWNVDKFLYPFIQPERTNTMLLGIDASRETHRSYNKYNPFRKKSERSHFPSSFAVVAVVLEKEWSCRQVYLLNSKRAQEISGAAVSDALEVFIDVFRRTFPQHNRIDRIIVFRDGVANTQVKKLREEEIEGMIEVLKHSSPETKLSFILIQKRVKAFFTSIPDGKNDDYQQRQHPDPGSVISNGVTFSQMQISSFYLNTDFYLVSSTGSGDFSSKPCHYLLLHNDLVTEENEDDVRNIQKLTFACCNLYFGFRGTIKTPFVAQCAHKLADKIYKSIFTLRRSGEDNRAKELILKSKFYRLRDKNVYEGEKFECFRDEVRVCIHKNLLDSFFEL